MVTKVNTQAYEQMYHTVQSKVAASSGDIGDMIIADLIKGAQESRGQHNRQMVSYQLKTASYDNVDVVKIAGALARLANEPVTVKEAAEMMGVTPDDIAAAAILVF